MKIESTWILISLGAVLTVGCASTPEHDPLTPAPEVFRKWTTDGSYYALLEIVDAHIDPDFHKASKTDVRKYLGQGCDSPDLYPNAGPKMWVYPSSRRVPYGSYLIIEFDDRDMVKGIDWVDE